MKNPFILPGNLINIRFACAIILNANWLMVNFVSKL